MELIYLQFVLKSRLKTSFSLVLPNWFTKWTLIICPLGPEGTLMETLMCFDILSDLSS